MATITTAPRYVILSNDGPAFILCIEDGEATSVQLTDYLGSPDAFSSLVWSTSDLQVAKAALARARRRARDWRCPASTIGIYDVAANG
jgi:hypothetical protein